MSRWIDIEPILEWCSDPEVCEPYGINSVELERKIRKAPSIDIVRCGECKRAFDAEGEIICNHLSGMVGLNVVVKADDYCSYGEREGE